MGSNECLAVVSVPHREENDPLVRELPRPGKFNRVQTIHVAGKPMTGMGRQGAGQVSGFVVMPSGVVGNPGHFGRKVEYLPENVPEWATCCLAPRRLPTASAQEIMDSPAT